MRLLVFILSILSILTSNTALADRTDIVYLKNGDRITGEVSEMARGELRLETDALGNITIKWENVAGIETGKIIQLEDSNGARIHGTVSLADDGNIAITAGQQDILVPVEQVIHLEQIRADQSLWDAMDKDLRAGFSFTQASDVLRWNVGAGLSYKTLNYQASVRTDSLVTNNGNGDDSRRADLTGSFQRFLRNRYFWFASASAETNDELGVDRRMLVSGGAGRYVFQTRNSELRLALGLAGNYENPTGDPMEDNTNDVTLEGLFNIDWTVFKLSTPSSRIHAQLDYLPSFSDGGRNRVDLKISLRQEFIEDLFWVVEAFGSYDSNPPPGAISSEDYGITTSLAYEW